MTARSISRPVTVPFARSIVGRLLPWTPAALFAQGQQGVWYEPKPEYLYQDSAGTTPVTADGQPVGYMQDLSGNGNHATQSTAAAKPLYRTDGTLHWLEADGVDDSISSAFSFQQDGGNTAVVGYRPSRLYDFNTIFDQDADSNAYEAWVFADGRVASRLRAGSYPGDISNAITVDTDFILSAYASDSAGSAQRIDGQETDSSGFIRAADAPFNLNIYGGALNSKGEGRFYGGIFVHGVLDITELISTEAHLATLAGVTL